MNIVIHDYAGHPFQVELSRRLALRQHRVTHIYFAGDKGPKGNMVVDQAEANNLSIEAIGNVANYSKTNFFKRRAGDIEYGRLVAERIKQLSPDIVISGNTPTETQEFILDACESVNAKFCYWCQDFYSIAATMILKKKLSFVGSLIGRYYQYLERQQMRRSDFIVHITDRFLLQTEKWGVDLKKVSVIPNWGALNEIEMLPKQSEWTTKQGLEPSQPRALYSGTLGLKHNPEFLRFLAAELIHIETVVVAAGVGVDYLLKHKELPDNLKVLPLQPFSEFSQVLASADVLLAVIESDAGQFSVPSKILSYLCAGKPIVLAAPRDNLAAEIIRQSGAGIVVDCEDMEGFRSAVKTLMDDSDLREKAGILARKYAEENFDIDRVTDRFETIVLS